MTSITAAQATQAASTTAPPTLHQRATAILDRLDLARRDALVLAYTAGLFATAALALTFLR